MSRLARRGVIAAALAAPAIARAQTAALPDRPISIVVPFAPGGPTDTLSRLIAEQLSSLLQHSVVVENTAGAGGTLGAARVAQARPDGSLLLMHHIGHASAATLYRRLPYDALTSFEPIGLVTEVPQVIISRPNFPAADLAALLATIRAEGEKLTLANAGLGGSDHLAGMLLQREAGQAVTTVGFRGAAPIIPEIIAGRVDLYVGQGTVLVPFVRDRSVKAYAVTSDTRLPAPVMDRVPTVIEAGFPGLRITVWHGLYAPRGTPRALVERFSRALQTALVAPRVVQRFADLATTPVSADRATPDVHRAFLASEIERLRPVILAAGSFAD
jgi:tripartite-type tricarboxylate transporter receptor subunit TctC